MTPIIVISDKFLDWKGTLSGYNIYGTFIFPFIVMRSKPESKKGIDRWNKTLNHESIHFNQSIELLVVFYLLIYGCHYLIGRAKGMSHYDSYKNVVFEKESNTHEWEFDYLKNRPLFNWGREKYPNKVE